MRQAFLKVGIVSLGCPKALVDSEHILTVLVDEVSADGAVARSSADLRSSIPIFK